MSFKELELFYYLCEDPHISQLSKKISMSQSAISLALKSLETSLGEPLFDRIGKKLILNERGRVFKEQTYKHFLSLVDAEHIFKTDKVAGKLRIGSSKTIGSFVTPQIVYDFLQTYSDSSIDKIIDNSFNIITKVLNGEIDIGFIEMSCSEPEIIKEPLVQDELIIVTSNKALSQDSYYIDQLYQYKWLMREKGSGIRKLFFETFGPIYKDMNIVMEFAELDEAKILLRNNPDMISCLSRFAVSTEMQDQQLYQVRLKNVKMDRILYLIYNKNKHQSIFFKTFKTYVQEAFGNYW